MTDIPAGFNICVIRAAKTLPYHVQVHLPQPRTGDDIEAPIRERGPELDIIIPDVPKRHELLGKFLEEWSLLEGMLSFLAKKLVETDRTTITYVMNTLGIRQIIDLINSLAVLKLSERDAEKIINLMERVGKLNSKRNVLVHGHWTLEVVILLEKGDAVARLQFVRMTTPSDQRTALRIADPKNQKERVKYVFPLKRIEGASRDVSTLSSDLSKALREIQITDAWTEHRTKLL